MGKKKIISGKTSTNSRHLSLGSSSSHTGSHHKYMSCDMRDWQLGDWNWKLCEKWKWEDGLKKMENMMLGGKRTWIWQQNWNDLMRCNAGKKDIFKEKNEVFPLEHINWKCHIFYLHPVLSLEGGLW